MENMRINPKFAGLNETANRSEVITSKFAATITEAGGSENMTNILPAMMEWSDLLKAKGIVLPDNLIEGVAEVYLSIPNDDVRVRSLHISTILDICLHYQNMVSSPLVMEGKMDNFLDNMYTEMGKLREIVKQLEGNMPRTVIKPSRGSKGKPTSSEGKSRGSDKQKDEVMTNEVLGKKVEQIMPEGMGSSNNEEMEVDRTVTQEAKTQEVKEAENTQVVVDYGDMKASSTDAADLRMRCRDHYNNSEFRSWGEDKKRNSLVYYGNVVLRISPTGWEDIADIYYMVHDLVDKDTMIHIFKQASSGQIPLPTLNEACDDFVRTVNMYYKAYGDKQAIKVQNGDIPSVELYIEV